MPHKPAAVTGDETKLSERCLYEHTTSYLQSAALTLEGSRDAAHHQKQF